MFDDISPWVALAFVGTFAVGAVLSRVLSRPRHRHDRIHPAE